MNDFNGMFGAPVGRPMYPPPQGQPMAQQATNAQQMGVQPGMLPSMNAPVGMPMARPGMMAPVGQPMGAFPQQASEPSWLGPQPAPAVNNARPGMLGAIFNPTVNPNHPGWGGPGGMLGAMRGMPISSPMHPFWGQGMIPSMGGSFGAGVGRPFQQPGMLDNALGQWGGPQLGGWRGRGGRG